MNDRELLEAAAKAAGMQPFTAWGMGFVNGAGLPLKADWNPLADDGDALRLAVTLQMDVYVSDSHGGCSEATTGYGLHRELHNGDARAATRRAIVRAAAALAKV